MWAGWRFWLQGLCPLRQWMRQELSTRERVEVLDASVMASPPICQVTLSNHFTYMSLMSSSVMGEAFPCPACLTDLSQLMGVCTLAQTTARVELPPG